MIPAPCGRPTTGRPFGASEGGTLAPVDPCPKCGRPFVLGAQPAGLLESSRARHVAVCTGPPGPVGRPSILPGEVVTRIDTLYRGGMGLRAIARLLTAEQVPTAHGGKWEGATVRAVLLRARRG